MNLATYLALEQAADAFEAFIDLPASALEPPTADKILAAAIEATGFHGYREGTLTGRQHLDLLHEIRLSARAWLRQAAEALLAALNPEDDPTAKALFGDARKAVAGFFKRASKYLREALTAGAMAILGPDPITAAEQEAIERNHAVQSTYLEQFRRQVLSEAKSLDGTFVARAEMYGSSTFSVGQSVARDVVRREAIFDQERRLHIGRDIPCDPCAEEEAKGWRPIGTLLGIGENTPCMNQCHCVFEYRKGNGGVPHAAGHGPLNPRGRRRLRVVRKP